MAKFKGTPPIIKEITTCYQCPKYHHAGAFGSPRYKPMCGSEALPRLVDENNHASPNQAKISCSMITVT